MTVVSLAQRPKSRDARIALVQGRERLAKVFFSTAHGISPEGVFYVLDPDGADLSELNSGHAPLLAEHFNALDHLLGVVQEVWRTEEGFEAVVRFARRPAADEIRNLLLDGMPVCASVAYRTAEIERLPDVCGVAQYRALRWTPFEISIVAQGRDPKAHLRANPNPSELAAERDERRAERLEQERAQRLAALKADAWRGWARNGAATALAAELALEPDAVRDPLARLVDQHLQELESFVGGG